jgi:predicted enzyme related to lactoylglutathione lyase
MQVLRLYWLGIRTTEHDATVGFFRDVLGLAAEPLEPDFTVLRVPDGSTVEVFGPASDYNRHLTCPVAGFLVADLPAAAAELTQAGAEIVLPIQQGDTGSWLHFRGPDGHLYELSQQH